MSPALRHDRVKLTPETARMWAGERGGDAGRLRWRRERGDMNQVGMLSQTTRNHTKLIYELDSASIQASAISSDVPSPNSIR
jgi:hypothetical protein